jgi:hypothetical protein
MKTKFSTLICALLITWAGSTSSFADDSGGVMVVDAVIVRPVCLVATVVGSVVFVAIVPFQAIFQPKSIKSTAGALVAKPAKATFTRPIGDMDALEY